MRNDERDGPVLARDGSNVGWSTIRARQQVDEKDHMAAHFAEHDFLVPPGGSPQTDPRITVASILVTHGTTQNSVVDQAIRWMAHNNEHVGPFFTTWFTTGALVPATLRQFRTQNPEMFNAARLFLFPGLVDQGVEGVSGPEAEEFAMGLRRRFTYSLLSAYAFDVSTGQFFFHFSSEIRLQRACALLYAAHKFIFLDSSKFRSEGEVAYNLKDLLATANCVTIYSGATDRAGDLQRSVESLFHATLDPPEPLESLSLSANSKPKTLRLELIGMCGLPSRSIHVTGVLRK